MDEPTIVNVHEVPEIEEGSRPWGAPYKILTPSMRPRGGRLGVNQTRVPPGHSACPFHAHLREDEVFFVLSGRGIFRYGDTIQEIREGDCISCPAGLGVAHQLANPFEEDLVYLAIGPYDPHEVCTYPDNGKVLVRGVRTIGFLEKADYMAGEPAEPRIFQLYQQK